VLAISPVESSALAEGARCEPLSYADSPPRPALLGVVTHRDSLFPVILDTVTGDSTPLLQLADTLTALQAGGMSLVMLTSSLECGDCLAVALGDRLGCLLAAQALSNRLRLVERNSFCALIHAN